MSIAPACGWSRSGQVGSHIHRAAAADPAEMALAGALVLLAVLVEHGAVDPQVLLAPRFERFWQQLAQTYLFGEAIAEYEALIHGIGVKSGGVKSIGAMTASRGAPIGNDVVPSRSSRWATSFKMTRAVGSDGNDSRSRYSVDRHIDWDAEEMVEALHCISASIHNVVAALRIVQGAGDVTFMVPIFGESEFPKPRSASSVALCEVP